MIHFFTLCLGKIYAKTGATLRICDNEAAVVRLDLLGTIVVFILKI